MHWIAQYVASLYLTQSSSSSLMLLLLILLLLLIHRFIRCMLILCVHIGLRSLHFIACANNIMIIFCFFPIHFLSALSIKISYTTFLSSYFIINIMIVDVALLVKDIFIMFMMMMMMPRHQQHFKELSFLRYILYILLFDNHYKKEEREN